VSRTVWLLNSQAFGERLLGPGVRLCEMARAARDNGHDVRVVVESPRSNPLPEGIPLRDWGDFSLDEIRPGDAVVANAYLGFPRLWRLLRSEIPFHLDLYCLTATEMMPMWNALGSPGAAARGLRKRRLRYVMTASRAETTWVSCREQALVLAGMFLAEGRWERARLSDAGVASSLQVPMGVRSDAFPTGSANPYPQALHDRPVFLWGGNLWSWMDLPTLADAFGILSRRGDPAVLFLLARGNRSGRADEDAAVREFTERCARAGTLGTSVVFNDREVGPDGLAPWLEHAHSGVMANLPSLESQASWRTRYLDLLWAGKPLVVSGDDPLADRMSACGAAAKSASGDAEALADAIAAMGRDGAQARRMGAMSKRLGEELSWSRTLAPFLDALEDPAAFRHVGIRPSATDLFRYFRP